MPNLLEFTPSQLSLIRNTIAKDANPNEFNLYVELCKARGLNPLLRHAFCFIFHKDKADKRQMVIVVSREGQRAIAERTGSYRPDERAPRFTTTAKTATNPLGIESAEVSVYKHSHGEWFPVTEVAYWDEYAPVVPIWEDNKKTDRVQLDPKKDGWKKMPRIMLAKCAEMAALRKAFPDDFGGLYGEGEIDRGEVLDLTPAEWADKAEHDDRVAKIGGPNMMIIDWCNGDPLQAVPAAHFLGQAMDFIKAHREEPSTIAVWNDRNRETLRQYWGVKPAEALELKREIERVTAEGETAA